MTDAAAQGAEALHASREPRTPTLASLEHGLAHALAHALGVDVTNRESHRPLASGLRLLEETGRPMSEVRGPQPTAV